MADPLQPQRATRSPGQPLMSRDIVGWLASAILLATLVRQIAAQMRDPDARGVSRWLFIGQSAASIGFIVYSAMLDNLVFIVTNSCILATALVGQGCLLWRRRRDHETRL